MQGIVNVLQCVHCKTTVKLQCIIVICIHFLQLPTVKSTSKNNLDTILEQDHCKFTVRHCKLTMAHCKCTVNQETHCKPHCEFSKKCQIIQCVTVNLQYSIVKLQCVYSVSHCTFTVYLTVNLQCIFDFLQWFYSVATVNAL